MFIALIITSALLIILVICFAVFVVYHYQKVKTIQESCNEKQSACPICPSAVGARYQATNPQIKELMERVQRMLDTIQKPMCNRIRGELEKKKEDMIDLLTSGGDTQQTCGRIKMNADAALARWRQWVISEDIPYVSDYRRLYPELQDATRELVFHIIDLCCDGNRIDVQKAKRLIGEVFTSLCG